MTTSSVWVRSWRADPDVRPLADRHYTRQSVGHPQFVPPGRCLVLKTVDNAAYWVSSWPNAEYVKHAWAGAWTCTAFRNEAPERYRSSDLIREAVRLTWDYWSPAPTGDPFWRHGFISFVDASKVRPKRDPGRCFARAGWARLTERTAAGLVVMQLLPIDFPSISEVAA